MNRRILIVCICLLSVKAFSQEYYVKQYRVEKGLPSDIVKACIQDSLGYFWIATDEGIVKYDGINFTSYRATMRSNYTKGFLKTRDGRLIAYGDLDVMEIQNLGDTIIFKRVCPVSRITSDTALSYPKVLFEDAQETLWASESQAVVRIKSGKLKRFVFDFANRSPQFLRSFSFFEDRKQNLFTASFQGNVFRFNAKAEKFDSVLEKFPAGVEFVSVEGNKLIIGSGEGVYEAALKSQGGFETPVLKLKIPFVSYLAKLADGKYFVATRGRQHFIADLKDYSFRAIPNSIHNINHVYVSRENDTWISGNDGLIMMRENLFQGANTSVTDFIESITEDPDTRLIYYATSQTMYSYHRGTHINKVLLHMPGGYFQSLLFTKEGVWAANAFKVFLWVDGKIKKEFDFTKYARFITALSQDSEGNIWLAMPGNKFAFKIDREHSLHKYRVDFKQQGVVNMIREGKDGMYITSAGKDSYLFFKAPSDTVFKNISIPLKLYVHSEFNATDLVIMDDKLWLATTEGLLKFDRSNIEIINLGNHFTGLPVKSVHPHPHNKLLASTPYGMILYDIETGDHDLFNESSGLLSNTITPQGFFVGRYERVWIGTAKGLCYSTGPLTELEVTPKPLFTKFSVNGNNRSISSQDEIEYGSFVSIQASSITFPENEITLQYRILPDSNWRTSDQPEIQFSALSFGNHTLEVRAKKNGPYEWSASSLINFTVAKPLWERVWFYLVLIVTIAFVMALTYAAVIVRSRKRTRELERLVDARTQELQLRNEDLVELNDEKNNLIGIVAHDLKSPLRQIMGLLSLIKMTAKPDEETKSYLGMVEESTVRLDGMIMKILDVEAIDSKQLNLNMEQVNFSNLIETVASRYQTEADHKKISIFKKIEPEVYVTADKSYLEQVVENLLSNAIKFSPHERGLYVNLTVVNGNARCEVKDEGPGITESDMKKLFGKYQKLSAKPTGTETSTGLGLSIIKKFVVAMKGKIWCVSEYGSGSSFFLSFAECKKP